MDCRTDPIQHDRLDKISIDDRNRFPPQHKHSSNNLEDNFVKNRSDKMTDLTPSSYQERKAVFMEQARRFVKYTL